MQLYEDGREGFSCVAVEVQKKTQSLFCGRIGRDIDILRFLYFLLQSVVKISIISTLNVNSMTRTQNMILPSSRTPMMKYLTRATAYGVISIFMSVSMVHVTYATSSSDELLLKQVQQEVKRTVRSE